MLTLESHVTVPGLTGREVSDFLLAPEDARYQAWWPGTHLAFHPSRAGSGGSRLGDRVLMDEYVGSRHIRMVAEVVEVTPGERVVWQMCPWGLRLPVRLTLTLRTHGGDVRVRHTITAGWPGRARVLDPLWRLYFSPSFAGAMDRHVHTEFLLLRELLRRSQPGATEASIPMSDRPDVDVP